MDADLVLELSGETWVVATYMDELKADLPPAGSDPEWPGVVGMCGIISGAAVLVAAGREYVSGHGGEAMASPGPSCDVLSTGRGGVRTTGSHSPFP